MNLITKKDRYPLPRIDDILESLSGAAYLSTLDATSGYYQIELEEESKEVIAFSWRRGQYEFNRMPFGLCNAPVSYQRFMDSLFKDNSNFVLPYLDDVIILSKTKEEH